MSHLPERIKAFLNRPIPAELEDHYAPENMAETLMTYYLAGERFDAEACEMLQLIAVDSEHAIEGHDTPEAKEFFRESLAITEALLAEQCGGSCIESGPPDRSPQRTRRPWWIPARWFGR
jgi:hypothetical protein